MVSDTSQSTEWDRQMEHLMQHTNEPNKLNGWKLNSRKKLALLPKKKKKNLQKYPLSCGY